jgi:hypothetical protein
MLGGLLSAGQKKKKEEEEKESSLIALRRSGTLRGLVHRNSSPGSTINGKGSSLLILLFDKYHNGLKYTVGLCTIHEDSMMSKNRK